MVNLVVAQLIRWHLHSKSQLSILMLRSLYTIQMPSHLPRVPQVLPLRHVHTLHRHHSTVLHHQELQVACLLQQWLCQLTLLQQLINPLHLLHKIKTTDSVKCKCQCLIVQTLHPKCRWQQLQVNHCWPLPLYLPSLHCRIHIKGTCHIRHNINMWFVWYSREQVWFL